MAQGRPHGVEVVGVSTRTLERVLTDEALQFLKRLAYVWEKQRRELLLGREEMQKKYDAGMMPDFLPETKHIREGEWRVDPVPERLLDRRVEITGPTDRKMVINALNSGANVFMACFEDSTAPTWKNMLEGQANLYDAVRGTITYKDEKKDKLYALGKNTATLMVRPRGLHLREKHLLIDGEPISASLFDFGLYFFHNARKLLSQGRGVYLYLPKLESYQEAAWWNNVIGHAEAMLKIPIYSTKVTVLIETLPAVFQMHEILNALEHRAAGLNCGRWDYIFSFIKKMQKNQGVLFPDRSEITMRQPFLRAYAKLLVQTCHKRGAHAMGGMAAQIPVKNDPEANEKAMEKVYDDKLSEAALGFDGTWVAHPGLVDTARKPFDNMTMYFDSPSIEFAPNQLDKMPEGEVTAQNLLAIPEGKITEEGLRANISVSVRYLFAWLSGNGCVPINNLMEDAATAEIARAQVWQWLNRSNGILNEDGDGRAVTQELVLKLLSEEVERIVDEVKKDREIPFELLLARDLFEKMVTSARFTDFLTLVAYEYL